MSAGDAIGFALVVGAGWLWWKGQQQAAAPVQLVPVSYTAPPPSSGTDWAGLGQGLAQIFGGISAPRAAPGPQGGSASVSGGGQMGNGLLGFLGGIFGTGQTVSASRGGAPSAAPVSGLLDVIARGEANNGYNSYYAGSKVVPPQPISTMTVAQVQAFQSRMVAAGSASDAVGRYQIIGSTLSWLLGNGTLSQGEVFDAAAQDKAGTALLNRRGLGQYQAGQIDATTFANNLAKEWASLPVVSGGKTGQSYYAGVAGNRARIGVSTIMGAVQGVA